VAARYGELVEAQVRSADLKDLAAEAGAGAEGREALVERLLERIHHDVRYTAMDLGESSLVPVPPAETLKRRYGDYQAALLIALLRRDLEPELPGLD